MFGNKSDQGDSMNRLQNIANIKSEEPRWTGGKMWLVYDVGSNCAIGLPLPSAQDAVDAAKTYATNDPGSTFVILESIAAMRSTITPPEEIDIANLKLG